MENNAQQDDYGDNRFHKPEIVKQQSLKKDPVLISLDDLNKTLKSYIAKLEKEENKEQTQLKNTFESAIREVFSNRIDVNLVSSDIDLVKLFADSVSNSISESFDIYLKNTEEHSESLIQSISDSNKRIIEETSRSKLAKVAEAAFAKPKVKDDEKDEEAKRDTFADKLVSRINPETTLGKTAGFLTGDPAEMFLNFLDRKSEKDDEHEKKMADLEASLAGGPNKQLTPEIANTSKPSIEQPEILEKKKSEVDESEISAKTVVVNAVETKIVEPIVAPTKPVTEPEQIVTVKPVVEEEHPIVSTVTKPIVAPEETLVSKSEQQTVAQDIAEKVVKTVNLSEESIESLVSGISEATAKPKVSVKKTEIETPVEKTEKKERESGGGGIGSLLMNLLSKGGGMAKSVLPALGSMGSAAMSGIGSAASAAAPFALPALAVAGAGAAGYAAGTYLDKKFNLSGKVANAADSMGLTDVSEEDKSKTEKLEGDLRRKKIQIFGTDKPSPAMLAANAMVKRSGGGKFEPKLFKSLKEVDRFEYDGKVYDLKGQPVDQTDKQDSGISAKSPVEQKPTLTETVQQKAVADQVIDNVPIGSNTANVHQSATVSKAAPAEKSGDVISITNNDQSGNSGSRTLQYDRDYVYLARDKFRGSMNYSRGLT